MAWVRIDDDFFNHRKVLDLSLAAKTVFIAALCHCNSQLTDGFISTGAARSIVGSLGAPQKTIKELVDVGMWHKRADGFDVHDYLHYQPPAQQILAERAKAKERMQRLRHGRSSPDVRGEQQAELHLEVPPTGSPSPKSHTPNSQSSVPPPLSRQALDDDDREDLERPGDTPSPHDLAVEAIVQRDLAERLQPHVVARKGPVRDQAAWLDQARRRRHAELDGTTIDDLNREVTAATGPYVPSVDETRARIEADHAQRQAELEQADRARTWLDTHPDRAAQLRHQAERTIVCRPGPGRDALVDAHTIELAANEMPAES